MEYFNLMAIPNFIKSRNPIQLTTNKEIIGLLMEQHSADHFNKAVLSTDDMLIQSFDLEHHVSVDLTQSEQDEEIQEIVCLNGIDEDGDDEVLESEDLEFGDEDNEVDIMGVPVSAEEVYINVHPHHFMHYTI